MKLLSDILTGSDNATFETVRVGGVLSLIALFGFQGWSVYRGAAFAPESFAIAASTILVAVGGGVALKRRADAPPEG